MAGEQRITTDAQQQIDRLMARLRKLNLMAVTDFDYAKRIEMATILKTLQDLQGQGY
jgi:hypothetical protein